MSEEIMIDGKIAFTTEKAKEYLGVSKTAFVNILKKNPQVKKWKLGYGKQQYILKEDLDELKKPRTVE